MVPSIFLEENMGSWYFDNVEVTGTYKPRDMDNRRVSKMQ